MSSDSLREQTLTLIAQCQQIAMHAVDVRDIAVSVALKDGVPASDIGAVLNISPWAIYMIADRANQLYADGTAADPA